MTTEQMIQILFNRRHLSGIKRMIVKRDTIECQ